ncbi:type VII secretion-associated serine protease [Streptomyces inusitatus]|uniref:Type VII secretion-associated serine protease n=2 Tax=Streptomyces inusitatus TaxID=68221 RepID=A0A918QJ39_9ACTN|nr:S8 family serine peptidase [Streptomyces inusitatus]GGZ47918.1 type VII secretion-associated serine protease [Streptomyces inusitatus]
MSQARKYGDAHLLRRSVLCAVAAVGAWAVGVAGVAPAAAAAENVRSKQWYLDAMNAEKVWRTAAGEGIKIAVVDSGVNSSTPSLKGQVLKGFDATGAVGEETDDYSGHGTTMAELIAGTGQGGGLHGLAPKAKIIPFRIAFEEFEKKYKTEPQDSAAAIRAAADSDAHIISMSFGSEFLEAGELKAVKYAESKGKLLFAAAGNSGNGENKAEYPAQYPEVVGVAASAPEGQTADYSQSGDFVDLAAPGSDIPYWCDATFKSYCDGDGGTSAATAIASASAALIWSANPDWTANQVLRVMFESAGKGKDGNKKGLSNFYGHGVVRPGAHINRGLGKPGDPDVSPLTNKRTSGSSASPTASAPGTSQPPKGESSEAPAVASSSGKSEDGNGTGLILGGVAVVVVLAGGGFLLARRRRNA